MSNRQTIAINRIEELNTKGIGSLTHEAKREMQALKDYLYLEKKKRLKKGWGVIAEAASPCKTIKLESLVD